jgi:hypothetical protein
VYGSSGYFSRGAVFGSAALELPVKQVHLGPPNVVADDPRVGRITSTQAPTRQIQLGFRFVF